MRKLLLTNHLALGDVVVLTAAVRDLHRCYPGQFLTDVQTNYPELWENSPLVTRLDPEDAAVEKVRCEYPLIHLSNQAPYHMVHGFIDGLNARLGLEIHATEFKGDIYLSERERRAPSPMRSLIGRSAPYWLMVAGGKNDVTIKWWDVNRYQAIVDHFQGRIQFVQIGAAAHYHPPLRGTLDLRGRTTVRQLVRWLYHAQGVVCGVTGLMHMAAAVESPLSSKGRRPCVVIAGGREPAHWEQYPGHQFLHTIGALSCCAAGGCWRSRTVALNDGDSRDHPSQLCLQVRNKLPRCMDLITAEDVSRRIRGYFDGEELSYLTAAQARVTARLNHLPVPELERATRSASPDKTNGAEMGGRPISAPRRMARRDRREPLRSA